MTARRPTFPGIADKSHRRVTSRGKYPRGRTYLEKRSLDLYLTRGVK